VSEKTARNRVKSEYEKTEIKMPKNQMHGRAAV
jgi:hypothetical protein